MARIRTIKPEFWSHPVMGKLDDASKMLAIAILNFADDEGYFWADPVLLRNFARPFDDDSSTTRRSIDTLIKSGWIEVAEHDSHGLIGKVANFTDHQIIDRAKPSKIKDYFISSINRRSIVDQSSPEQGTGKGKEGNGKEENPEGMQGDGLPGTALRSGPDQPSKPAKIQKHKRGKLGHVLLTDDELAKLQTDYPNADAAVEFLDEYIEMKGYKAKSHYLAIRKWVFQALARTELEAKQLAIDQARIAGKRPDNTPDFAALAAAARSTS